ncbi:MAG TPA: toll/interleukin-1 receptor domain-containing protein, partial [Bacteroidia bacterium]|nr:toll/interleukin-1 receptor domain-containing protein [Bacteroidia bacterium]
MAIDQFDVYLSYAPEDEAQVRRIAEELEWVGLKVWFRDQPSTSQESLMTLRSRINNSNCHVVVWSNNSAGSGRIQAEARAGSGLRRLIATRIHKDTLPPPGTDALAYADLSDWNGGTDHKGMRKLLKGIWDLTGKGLQPPAAEESFGNGPGASTQTSTFGAQEENLTPEQKDERAWQTCLAYNNRTYYEHYLRYFPNGRYAQEATERIAKKKRTGTIIATCAIIYVVG